MLVLCATLVSFAQNNSDFPKAIKGYDPVSYVENNKAEKGEKTTFYTYNHKNYLFVNETHKELFSANPEKYIPEYNGYCSYSMAAAKKTKANPKNFKIINGKTYLFFKVGFLNARSFWNKKDEKEQIQKADKNWKTKFK